jgi:GT2 family glycosyltransferase
MIDLTEKINTPRVSILLLTLDRYQLTRYCLESLLKKAGDVDFELLISDQGSQDKKVWLYLTSIVHSNKFRCTLTQAPQQQPTNVDTGIAAGYNRLLHQAKGEYIVFVPNDHMVLSQNWLLDAISFNDNIDKAGLTSIHAEGEKGFYSPLLNHDDTFTNVWLPKSNITSGISLINRAALEAVGAFDETLGVYGKEREQYAHRLHMLGYKNFYVPDQYAVHLGREINDVSDYKKEKDKNAQIAASRYPASLAEMKKSNNYKIPL